MVENDRVIEAIVSLSHLRLDLQNCNILSGSSVQAHLDLPWRIPVEAGKGTGSLGIRRAAALT